MTNSFVEDAFVLTPKKILDNLQDVMEIGKFMYKKPHPDVDYWLENEWDPSVVLISVGGKEPQRINIEWEQISFGERAYFRCSCNHRASKLYLPPGSTEFLCRTCHGLQYRLSSFNKNSTAGKAIYRMNRLQKLADSRAGMGRIIYDGKFSKKFESFLRLCDRAGLDSIVTGANDLKTLIQQ